MKNNLLDLNDHLFSQMERLNDESLKGDALKEEVNRAKSMQGIAAQIVGNDQLMLDAQKSVGETISKTQLPEIMTPKKDLKVLGSS